MYKRSNNTGKVHCSRTQCLWVGFKLATPQPQVGLNNYYTHCAMYSFPMDSLCLKNCVVGDRSTLLILLQSLIKLQWTNLLIINLKLFQLVFFPDPLFMTLIFFSCLQLFSVVLYWNAGQVSLGSSRPESSRPGSTRPGPILAYDFNYKNVSTILFMCFIKNVQQKFEGIMFGRIYILGLSILTILAYSTVPELHKGM